MPELTASINKSRTSDLKKLKFNRLLLVISTENKIIILLLYKEKINISTNVFKNLKPHYLIAILLSVNSLSHHHLQTDSEPSPKNLIEKNPLFKPPYNLEVAAGFYSM
jgi:hypothetical protein